MVSNLAFIFHSMVGMIFSNLTNSYFSSLLLHHQPGDLFFHTLGTIIPFDFHIFQRGRYTTNQKARRRIQQPARIRAKFKKTQEIRISIECVMRCFGSILKSYGLYLFICCFSMFLGCKISGVVGCCLKFILGCCCQETLSVQEKLAPEPLDGRAAGGFSGDHFEVKTASCFINKWWILGQS